MLVTLSTRTLRRRRVGAVMKLLQTNPHTSYNRDNAFKEILS